MYTLRLVLLALAAWPVLGADITVTVLATSDLHGNVYPTDYFTGKPAERGLAKLATRIAEVRKENPNTVLIDVGDTIQGSAMESVWQYWAANRKLPVGLKWSGRAPTADPMMLAMNHLGFKGMVLGNHEFNFGLKNLNAARSSAKFPWLSANTLTEPGENARPFAPYIVQTVGGVKVAVIGLTTPSIPRWERPEGYKGYRWIGLKEATSAAVAELRKKHRPDVIIAAIHSGLSRSAADRGENSVDVIAREVPGIDGIFFGHTHNEVKGQEMNGVVLVQPKNWGISLGRIDITLEKEGARWRVVKRSGTTIPAAGAAADEKLLALLRPYHEMTERYLSTPVAECAVELDGRLGRVRDTALVDAINTVQMHYAKADVSFTSLFNPRVHVRKGAVTVREIAALYLYDNELFAIEGTGRMVKDALENSARFFQTCPDAGCSQGPLINRAVIGYQYDMAQGVDYEIDLTRAAGDRIVNLRRNGKPLNLDTKLRIALNNYRYGGSGGYSMFRGAKIVWQSSQDIRNLIIEYFTEHGRLPERPDGNWTVVPAAAAAVLATEAGEPADVQK
ncbi:MAG TPA: 5'-nucleotidase C-terminal domain-containing protein [Bryobacteraceae bacterium]|nr:5'-nucleotidase C-terminal domain-containing protein [Bryobacteraceae bacterium]